MGLRIILAGVVVVGATLCGKALSDAARQRASALGTLVEDVKRLRVYMVSMFEPVPDSLARAESPLLRQVGEGMRGGLSAGEAWAQVRRGRSFRAGPGNVLLREDREALDRLFGKLGESGRESQEVLLSGTAEQLERLEAAAREKAGAAERLYVTLGLLVGLLLAVIVI